MVMALPKACRPLKRALVFLGRRFPGAVAPGFKGGARFALGINAQAKRPGQLAVENNDS